MRCQILEGHKGGMKNTYKICVGKPQDVKSHDEDWYMWGGVILDWFIKKQDGMMGTGFSWLKKGSNDELS
jgi:hypothetical protein